MHLHLSMVDTPGYADTLPTAITEWLNNITSFIQSRYDAFEKFEDEQLRDRASVYQQNENDSRMNVCLYFLSGPRISHTDLEILSRLQDIITIIPILAKGDQYTLEEVKSIKKSLIKEALDANIAWFDCETPLRNCPERLERVRNGPLGLAPPFLLITSVQKLQMSNQEFQYARKYPWGICKIEDPEHSDFLLLYQLLIGPFLGDLRKLTEFNYKNYLRDKRRTYKLIKAETKQLKKEQKKKHILLSSVIAVFGLGAVLSFFRNKQ